MLVLNTYDYLNAIPSIFSSSSSFSIFVSLISQQPSPVSSEFSVNISISFISNIITKGSSSSAKCLYNESWLSIFLSWWSVSAHRIKNLILSQSSNIVNMSTDPNNKHWWISGSFVLTFLGLRTLTRNYLIYTKLFMDYHEAFLLTSY